MLESALLRNRGRIIVVLGCTIVALLAAHIAAVALEGSVSTYTGDRIRQRFDLDREISLPAWFASTLLLMIGGLLAWVAMAVRSHGKRDVVRWWLLAAIFVAMSADETASFHELTIQPIRARIPETGIFHFAWVIPGIIGCAALAAAYWPTVWRLPAAIRWRVVAAGAIYVSGVLGSEMVGGVVSTRFGETSLHYVAITTVEEMLEMIGLVLFVHTMLGYLAHLAAEAQLSSTRSTTLSPVAALSSAA